MKKQIHVTRTFHQKRQMRHDELLEFISHFFRLLAKVVKFYRDKLHEHNITSSTPTISPKDSSQV